MLKVESKLDQPEASILARIKEAEPVITDSTLSNGARFLTACTPSSPSASIAIHFDAGSRREAPHEHGATHFFEHLPPAAFRLNGGGQDLVTFAALRAWNVGIQISQDQLSFGFNCPHFEAREAMTNICDILNTNDEVYRQVFPIERGRILNEIAQGEAQAGRRRKMYLDKLLFSDTGYGHPTIGTSEQVSGYTFEQIADLGRRVLSPQRATVAISGSSALIDEARAFFEQMPFRGTGNAVERFQLGEKPDWSKVPAVSKHSCSLFPGIQVEVLLPGRRGFEVRQGVALGVVIHQLSLELNRKLSHESGISYGAGASSSRFADTTVLSASCNVAPERVSEALKMIERALAELPEKLSERTIHEAYVCSRNLAFLGISSQNFGGVLDAMAATPQMPYFSTSENLARLGALTVTELREIAATFLDPSKSRLVLHGSDEALAKL
jgi:predicted Zn-dependent peptidase